LIVECDVPALKLVEETIRRQLAERGGSLDSMSAKQI
jgi:hypothetical protein